MAATTYSKSNTAALAIAMVWAVLCCAFSQHQHFFWDSIYSGSRVAHHFWEQGLGNLILPGEADAGHPPFFGLLLAGTWSLFGRSLPVSHWFMLPWLAALAWQLWRLARVATPYPLYRWAIFVLLLAEPTLLAQATLVSPELPLLLAVLITVNGILHGSRSQTGFGAFMLPLFSARGLLMLPALALAALLVQFFIGTDRSREKEFMFEESPSATAPREKAKLWPWLTAFAPGLLAAAAWLGWHYVHTGWFMMTPADEWAGQRQGLGPADMLRQVAVILFRFADNGRVLLFCFLTILTIKYWSRLKEYPVALILAALLLAFVPLFIPVSNPPGHRYFLLIYSMSIVLVCQLACQLGAGLRNSMLGLILAAFISAHFWTLPDGMAKGWDASLAYWPYAQLEAQALEQAQARGIAPTSIYSSFPATEDAYYTRLAEQHQRLQPIANDTTGTARYYLYSNLFNDDEAAWQPIIARSRLIYEQKAGQVYVRLYQR